MKILVLNCGSSSLKYKLVQMPNSQILAKGEAQRVGPPTALPSNIIHESDNQSITITKQMSSHPEAFVEIMKILNSDSTKTPDAIGHRIVHGGEYFSKPTIITDSTLETLNKVQDLAPIHNPPSIKLISACIKSYPDLPQVAVFDTAYHSTIPKHAFSYAIPKYIMQKYGLRKYGFHGTSHEYVAEQAANFLNVPISRLNAISCHLGSGGASLCAIKNGKSIDNTMGYTPLQGLVMSTRSGDIDPAVVLRLLTMNYGNGEPVLSLLNKNSGILGLSKTTSDIRDIISCLSKDNLPESKDKLAVEIYLWRLKKYLGSYLATVGNAKAVIFTDTIGESSPEVRFALCSGMQCFGMQIDYNKNITLNKYPGDVSAPSSKIRILVIKTDEELAIARKTYQTLIEKN